MNWGHKLTIGFTAFAAMIIFLAIRSFNVKFDMVEKDYYKNELRYQQVIDATKNANLLSSTFTLTKNGSELLLQMPVELLHESSTGTIWFYNPADASKDKRIELNTSNDGTQLIKTTLLPGNYTVKIQWTTGATNYYSEKQFSVL